MKEKVEEQEALADAYGEMADESKTIDEEIDKALNDSALSGSVALDELKREMGLLPKEEKIEIKEDVPIELEDNSSENTDSTNPPA